MSESVYGVMTELQPGWISSQAIDDTGHAVGGWVSSTRGWAKRDLPRSLPEGTEIVWVELDDPRLPDPCLGCLECSQDG